VKIQKAIEFLEVEIKCLEKEIEICNPNDDIDIQVIEANKNIIIKYNQVIILLQQGEKYRLIVEDLTKETIDKKDIYCNWLRSDINRLEQKYFPKDEKDSYFYECTPQTAPHLKKVLFKKANQEYKEGKE